MQIAVPSTMSLFIKMSVNGKELSTGTAFVVDSPRGKVLITNRHNLTGREQKTDIPLSPTLGLPDNVMVAHHRKDALGNWEYRNEPLYKEDAPLWYEHPTLGSRADFVALPLTQLENVQLFPHDLRKLPPEEEVLIGPADHISVIGFPFSKGLFPIWATGFVATDPDIDFDNLPLMLIDCRSRPGQSGSPVVAFRRGGAITFSDGKTHMGIAPKIRLMGIYSGRINSESDIGMVWKASAIKELVDSLT